MIAFVFGVTVASTSAGSRFRSSGPAMSQKTGSAPVTATAFAAATKLSEGTTTSSPGPHPSATRARWSAAVPFATASASAAPQKEANSRSSSATRGPMLHQPERTTSSTASTSSSSTRRSESGTCQRVCALVGTRAADDGGDRLHQDRDVKPDRPVLEVEEVQ